jgi:hypothetical protein
MAFIRDTIFVVDTANMRILLIDPATSELKDEIAANFNPDIEDIAINPYAEVMYLATGYDVSQKLCKIQHGGNLLPVICKY